MAAHDEESDEAGRFGGGADDEPARTTPPRLDPKGPRLTRRQDMVLRQSIRMGYYELPRRVHLRDIAKRLGTSVASLAEVLRRAEGRLAEAYVRESTWPGPGESHRKGRPTRSAGPSR